MKRSSNLDDFLPILSFLPIFETFPIQTDCLHVNTLGMMIQCFYHNFSNIYHLLLHISVLYDTFRLSFFFQPLITYQYQLIIIILLLSLLNKLVMLILVQTEKMSRIKFKYFNTPVSKLFKHIRKQ